MPAIARFDLYRYEVRYRYGTFAMSGGRVVSALPSHVVRLTTDDGVVGYGEACPLGTTYLPGFAGGVEAALREIGPRLVGVDATNLGQVNAVMDRALAGHGYAKAAVDVACWDVLGRVAGLPVSALLGGVRAEQFPLYAPVSFGDGMLDDVRQRMEEGIHRFQLKVGGLPEDDARRVAAVVDATGDGDVVVADANCAWRLPDAVIAARLLDPLPRVHLEQPCATLDECLAVRERTSLPFVLDEVITDVPTLLRAYAAHGLDAVNCKVSRLGGLTRARAFRDLATGLGLRVTIEDTWGGDIASAAVAHLAASTDPDGLFMVSLVGDITDGHVAGHQPRGVDGFASAPTGPGLGIDVDDDRLGPPLLSVAA